MHEIKTKTNAKFLQTFPTGQIGRLRNDEFFPNRTAGNDRFVGPPRRPPLGHRALRQQASSPGRRHGDLHLYDTRTGRSCEGPGASCERNVLKRPASVREERVLCKSILSPQREPIGESIIRRVKPPMLPKVQLLILAIFADWGKISKIVPRVSTTFPLAWRVALASILAWQPLLGAGVYSLCRQGFGAASERFAFRWYKPCCMPPCRSGIIRAMIAGGQSPFSSCDTSLQLPVTAKSCSVSTLPK